MKQSNPEDRKPIRYRSQLKWLVGFGGFLEFLYLSQVIPVFKEMFDSVGATLPLPTRMLIVVGDLMSDFNPVAVVALIAVVAGAIYLVDVVKPKTLWSLLGILAVFGLLLVLQVSAMFLPIICMAEYTGTAG